ncbi:cyclase family protein [Micromonospora sp. NPDC049523]|uniref:cyclase family protein n=1 Tax=Micromonospora sp. NPDC049523 TaxID=3155921 RepID=UPI0034141C5B
MTRYEFKSIGQRLSNWGRWGADDQRGTLNFLTPQVRLDAARSVRTGQVFELSIPIGRDGPQQADGGAVGRINPVHLMSVHPGDFDRPDGMVGADDYIFMPLQAATHWDGLAHIGYDGLLYNGVPANSIRSMDGAKRHAIDQSLPGVVGRGILLDIARLHGRDWLAPSHPITPDELDEAVKQQNLTVRSGDVLLVRTGWRRKALVEGWHGWMETEPGLTVDCAGWLSEREISAVASDNWAIETQPAGEAWIPLHCVLIRDMGMTLGENFNLEELSEACAADGRWDLLLSAPALRILGGTGSPVSPIAIR